MVGNLAYVADGSEGLRVLQVGAPAAAISYVADRTYRIDFPEALAGTYAIQIGPEILNPGGIAMDQDDDGAPREPSEDLFTARFTVYGPPTDIALSGTGITEGQPVGSLVGSFSCTDPNPGETFTYALVSGPGDTDNASFTIAGDQLETGAVFDHKTKDSYSIRVRTTDGDGLWYEEALIIMVINGGPQIVSTSPALDGVLPPPVSSVEVTFSEPIDPVSFQVSDVSLIDLAGPQISELAQFGGRYQDCEVVGSTLYAATKSALKIFDISDPTAPVRLGGYATSGELRDVEVVGDRAYLADWQSGLQILDVSDPAAPVLLGAYDTSGAATYVHVVGDLAYVADFGDGLQILDVSDPAAPVRLGGYDTSEAWGVDVVGTLAYVADYGSGLQILDVSDPAAPIFLGNYDTPGSARGVDVVGSVAYVADYGTLQILDVSNSAAPSLLDEYYPSGGNPWDVQVIDEVAYLANGSGGVEFVDVSVPTAPVHLGEYDMGHTLGVEVVGDLVYVADDGYGLHVLNVSNLASPEHVGEYDGLRDAEGVQVVGDLIYIAGGSSGLQILDVSDPAVPVRTGKYATLCNDVHVVGDLAYIANGGSGLKIVDVSDPTAPAYLSYCDTPGSAVGVQVVGNVACIADDDGGLATVDVSDPAAPVLLGGYDTLGRSWDVDVVGDLAYLADGQSGLEIFDVSDPATPVRLGGYGTSGSAVAAQVVGNLAYVAEGWMGIEVLDVSDPTAPILLGGYDTPGSAEHVHVVGTLAYVADYSGGLQILDVSDPTSLVFLGGYDTAGLARDVHVAGNLAYVADYNEGLSVLQIGAPAAAISHVADSTYRIDFGETLAGDYVLRIGPKILDVAGTAMDQDGDGTPHEPNEDLFSARFSVGQPPTDITLSGNELAENQLGGTLVGSFSSTDPDSGETFTYALASGPGDTDNASFTIAGDQLKSNAVFDYETKTAYSIRVRTTDQAGLSYEEAFNIMVTDVDEIPPTAVVGAVTPDPRNTAIDQVTITFSEAVTGFALADLTLTRDGGDDLLTPSQALTTADNVTWTLDNLTGLTEPEGNYQIQLTAAGSEIWDAAGNPLAGDTSEMFAVDVTAPTVEFADVTPNPRNTALGAITIIFSEVVTGFELADLQLTRDAGANLLTGEELLTTTDHVTWTLAGLLGITDAQGSYLLTLTGTGSGIQDPAGNLLSVDATEAWIVDTANPDVEFEDVAPDPRNTAVDQITITFSEAVTGFDLADLELSRDGGGSLLTAAQTLTTSDNITWTLGNLAGVTGAEGHYHLELDAADSGIQDSVGNLLGVGDSDPWTVERVAPTVAIANVIPDPRNTAVAAMTIVFGEAVTGFDLSDLQLTRDGGSDLLTGAQSVATADNITWTLSDLSSVTSSTGNYVLTLVDENSEIQDAAGNALEAGATQTFVVDSTPPIVDIVDVSPDPRHSSIEELLIVFSEAVDRFDLTDLQLTRGGGANLLSDDQTLTTTDRITWTLANLHPLTHLQGDYELTLTAAGSEIQDGAGNALATDASDDWTFIPAGILVDTGGGLVTTEAGGEAAFTVRLSAFPSADVTVSFSSSNTDEGILSTTDLTFTPLDWNLPQTVTVTGVDDNEADGDVDYQIAILPVASTDPNYASLDPADVSVVNEDDDTPGVLVDPASGLVTTESGGTAQFTLRLRSQPTADVEIAVASSDATEGTASVGSLLFTSQNWNEPQTVTILGVDDLLLDGDVDYTVTLGPVTSDDPLYAAIDPVDATATNTDYEMLDLTIAAPSISENAGTEAITATVTRSNIDDLSESLTLTLTSSDTTEVVVPPTVIIPAGQASADFDIDAVDDMLLDGTQLVSIIASAHGYADGIDTLEVTDHEVLTLAIIEDSISENAGAGTASAVVTRSNVGDLTSPLTVALSSNDTTEATVPDSVVIPGGEASAAFDFGAIDDMLLDGTQAVLLTASAGGYVDGTDTIEITDHETLTLTLAVDVISEAAGAAATTGTVTRSNVDNLTDPMTVTIGSSDPSEATVPTSVVIPSGHASASFDVDAIDDGVVDGSQSVTITVSAASYVNGSDTLEVTDLGILTLSAAAGAVFENAGVNATTITVTRSYVADISSPLVVDLSSSDTSEANVPASITIPADQASVSLSLDAVDDALLDGDQAVLITASADGFFQGTASLDILDHETLELHIEAHTISESDGVGATTGTVTRSNIDDLSEPLTVALSSSDTTEAVVVATVVILAGEESAVFDVDAINDGLPDGGQQVVVRASAAGYVPADDTITVADQGILTLDLTSDTIFENDGDNATIVLLTRTNTGDVSLPLSVTLASSDTSEARIAPVAEFAAGQTSLTLAIDAIDDALLDGTQTVTITASAPGYVSGVGVVNVADHENLVVSLQDSSVSENAGSGATLATITRSNIDDLMGTLSVALTSGDTSAVAVVPTVILAPGQASIEVEIDPIDDDLLDGAQTATITASAPGYVSVGDMLTVLDYETLTFAISDFSIAENAGPGATTAILTRSNTGDLASPLAVELISSDSTEATVLTTVTLPAGEASMTVDVNAVDDDLLDGTQTVVITASAPGYYEGIDLVEVTDHETLTIVVATSSIGENAGEFATTATVSWSNTDDLSEPVTLSLSSDDTSEAALPSTVVAPAGASSVTLGIDAIDDALVDGTQTVVILASAPGYISGSDTLEVTDHETLSVVIKDAVIAENAGSAATTATIRRSADLASALTVDLATSDTSEATLPATVVIPVGHESVTIDVVAVDDTSVDGLQTVVITASAEGYLAGSDQFSVFDDEAFALSVGDATILEGDVGQTALEFTVSLSDDPPGLVMVQIDTSDSTATTADGDYAALTATELVFHPGGPLNQLVTVQVNSDTKIESDETLFVNLSNSIGAAIVDGQGRGTILNDDNPVPVDFNDFTIDSYGVNQDTPGGWTVDSGGARLQITGNHWKKIDLAYTVTADTILEFDYQSGTEGEIQGIGLDDEGGSTLNPEWFFQLYGTQRWGRQDFHDYEEWAPGVVHYVIPVGEFFTGAMSCLVFASDDDANVGAVSAFSNVRVCEFQLEIEVQGTSQTRLITGYSAQDELTEELSLSEDFRSLRFVGNAWKKLDLDYTVTADTILEFDYQSGTQGEIQGIGLDNDEVISPEWFFQVYGTQAWGNQAYHDYTGSGPAHYAIPVGQYVTGDMPYLVFAGDDDAHHAGENVFSNIRIYEPKLTVQLQDVVQSLLVTGYSDQDVRTRRWSLEGASPGTDGFQTLQFSGNAWKKVAFDAQYLVTANTILEFDYQSGTEGEIQGIGLDNDEVISPEWFFQLYGTQTWGKQAYRNYAAAAGTMKHYVISVGKYFTGAMSYLVFGGDDDANAAAEVVFSNIRLYEPTLAVETQGATDSYLVTSYGAEDLTQRLLSLDDVAPAVDGFQTLQFAGNSWKKIDLGYAVTANTVLEFDFQSSVQGEIQGIGFDNDELLSDQTFFQLYGTQKWGLQAYRNYASSAGETVHYAIPVGEFFSGAMSYLIFAGDDDAHALAENWFSNIRLYEGESETPLMASAGLSADQTSLANENTTLESRLASDQASPSGQSAVSIDPLLLDSLLSRDSRTSLKPMAARRTLGPWEVEPTEPESSARSAVGVLGDSGNRFQDEELWKWSGPNVQQQLQDRALAELFDSSSRPDQDDDPLPNSDAIGHERLAELLPKWERKR